MKQTAEIRRIESKLEVQTYLDSLKYAIQSGTVTLNFQKDRNVDLDRDKKYTNRYTVGLLFPDEDEADSLKRELSRLTVEEYIETVKDVRFPKRSEMRVFGKAYAADDVYIKIRFELISLAHASGSSFILVMSFHYSERKFNENIFPYRKGDSNENNK